MVKKLAGNITPYGLGLIVSIFNQTIHINLCIYIGKPKMNHPYESNILLVQDFVISTTYSYKRIIRFYYWVNSIFWGNYLWTFLELWIMFNICWCWSYLTRNMKLHVVNVIEFIWITKRWLNLSLRMSDSIMCQS